MILFAAESRCAGRVGLEAELGARSPAQAHKSPLRGELWSVTVLAPLSLTQKKLLQAVGSRRAWCLGIIQKLAKIYTALHIRKWSDTVRQIFCSTRI